MRHYVPALLLLLLAIPDLTVGAVDNNGYTAQYECRAGNPNCDVDIAALGNRACNQTITPSDPWSKINWSNNTICLQAGDHTSKGTLTIPSDANGSANNYKVLRYVGSSDNNQDLWKQASATRARVEKLVINGSYWVLHRLAFPSIDKALGMRLDIRSPVSNVIVSRILVEGMSPGFANSYTGIHVTCCDAKRITIQNSVVRNSWGKIGSEPHGITPLDGDDVRIVNNEIYDWSAHPIQMGRNGGTAVMAGFVVENNDIYQSSKMHLANGKARAKSTLSLKAGGTAAAPAKVIHNRIWGSRNSDRNACCLVGDAGAAAYFSNAHNYVLIQNNMFLDSQLGFAFYNGQQHNNSFIGNVFSGMRRFDSTGSSHAIETVGNSVNTEFYLNSFIDNSHFGMSFGGGSLDIRCNVFLEGGAREGGTPGSDTQADHNAFYATPPWSFNGSNTTQDISISTHKNATQYATGNVVRWSAVSNCAASSDAACFLYMAETSGSSASSTTQPCTTLGCTFSDGNVVWRAIRGPYAFYRKLRTGPELHVIPYGRVHATAREALACPSDFAARRGMGINDDS